jgi:hypothetical protein
MNLLDLLRAREVTVRGPSMAEQVALATARQDEARALTRARWDEWFECQSRPSPALTPEEQLASCAYDPEQHAEGERRAREFRLEEDAARERIAFLSLKIARLRTMSGGPPWAHERKSNSGLWLNERVKAAAWRRSGNACEGCGAKDDGSVRWLVNGRSFSFGCHHLSYWGVDPEHGNVYPLLGMETSDDLKFLCPKCHDQTHRFRGRLNGDIDRLEWQRAGMEELYAAIIEAFRLRTPGEPFYLNLWSEGE